MYMGTAIYPSAGQSQCVTIFEYINTSLQRETVNIQTMLIPLQPAARCRKAYIATPQPRLSTGLRARFRPYTESCTTVLDISCQTCTVLNAHSYHELQGLHMEHTWRSQFQQIPSSRYVALSPPCCAKISHGEARALANRAEVCLDVRQ